ncbi:AMP-binding protein [Sphingopyxis yananensis]|uniref:AMP-binding protein n=1 Tax=Sphingopyxis yananensis TaxID=2886687 RepID=UPI001D0FBCCE|nr:AMP-binding protein [Sphingopyxis yananensis]MCC2601173.1 AMP-binding protein [Sphingopyxis yananensis]
MTHPDPIKPPQQTVTGVLAAAVKEAPERIFLDFSGIQYSYADIDSASTRLANGLLALGVKQGDRVGTLLDTSVEAILIWFAANKIGAVYVPVNAAYKGEYLRHQFADAGVEVVFVEPDYADRLALIKEELPLVHTVIQRGDAPLAAEGLNLKRFDDILGSEDPVADPNKYSDISMLIYTGGTTGPSKGCIISHNYVCNLSRNAVINGKRTKDDISWSPLPLFHLNALAATVLASAMTFSRGVLYPRFSVSNFWPEIERSGATLANLLGSMLAFVADAPDNEAQKRCFGQLRAIRGSPFPPEVREKWRTRFGVKVTGSNVYGLTEASPVTSLHDDDFPKPGSSGKVDPSFEVRIVDDEDNDVPVGTPGEIIIRPRYPHVMFEGYWGRPEETLRIMKNLWLHSGDIGSIDEDGYFYFVDRKKDYLRRRGENISSFELERAFRGHPDIVDVAIHSVLSESAEDDVKATIVLNGESKMTEAEMCSWCADRVPYFAVPRYIEFRDELPRNPVGRVLKYQLRDEGRTPATWDREDAGFELAKR